VITSKLIITPQTKLLRPGYFNPDPAASIPLANIPGIDKLEILGVLTTAEIDMLFRQFMSKMNVR